MSLEAKKLKLIQWISELNKQEVVEQLLSIKHRLDSKQKRTLSSEKRGAFGAIEGEAWMTDDFNSPLEDFKEYMP